MKPPNVYSDKCMHAVRSGGPFIYIDPPTQSPSIRFFGNCLERTTQHSKRQDVRLERWRTRRRREQKDVQPEGGPDVQRWDGGVLLPRAWVQPHQDAEGDKEGRWRDGSCWEEWTRNEFPCDRKSCFVIFNFEMSALCSTHKSIHAV